MTRTIVWNLAIGSLVLVAAGGQTCLGDPPIVIDPEALAALGPGQAPQLDDEPALQPRVESYSNSGCKGQVDGGSDEPCAEDDELVLTVEGTSLHVLHLNATYDCCIEDIVISLVVEENLLILTEEEFIEGGGCDCWCCYDVEATVVDLAPGTYTVEFCWFDYEIWEPTCVWDEIVVSRGGGDSPRLDPPGLADPNDVSSQSTPQVTPIGAVPPPPPQIADYANSGCLDDPNDPWYPPCGDDEIELVVDGDSLHVLHGNAMYNCCLDDIVISLTVEENLLLLTEEEIVPEPCWCTCCYNVETTVVGLTPGSYTVEFCWFDYETDEVLCYTAEIVVPGS